MSIISMDLVNKGYDLRLNKGMCTNFLAVFNDIYNRIPLVENNYRGIVKGSSGTLLCCVQRYLITREVRDRDEIYALVDKMTSLPVSQFSLGYGLAGFAWVISLIQKFDLFENVDEWLTDFESVLEKHYCLMLYKKDVDYFRGASGILFYFLERGLLNKGIVKSFIDCLYERESGICPSYYINRDKSNINLGTPHGITGIILILLRLKELGENMVDSLILELLEELLSLRRTDRSYNFPRTVFGKDESPSIVAWCYGDLMASYSILKAGLLFDKKKYIDLVYPILTDLAQREDCSNNLSLCHGYNSSSLVFRKMFELTNNKALHIASIKWQNIAMSTFQMKYEKYRNNQLNADYFEDESLFYGFSGFLLSFNGSFYRACEKSLLL
jgi:lantibiotic biosynthesis protein